MQCSQEHVGRAHHPRGPQEGEALKRKHTGFAESPLMCALTHVVVVVVVVFSLPVSPLACSAPSTNEPKDWKTSSLGPFARALRGSFPFALTTFLFPCQPSSAWMGGGGDSRPDSGTAKQLQACA